MAKDAESKNYVKEMVEILHSENAMELQAAVNAFNPFDVLRVQQYELRHNNVLAWLLDPKQTHGLGDLYLRTFVSMLPNRGGDFARKFELTRGDSVIVRREQNIAQLKKGAVELEGVADFSEITMPETTHHRAEPKTGLLDILLTSKIDAAPPQKHDWAIAIESKINSAEGDGQLDKYSTALENWWGCGEKESTSLRRLYLVKDSSKEVNAESKDRWTKITWEDHVLRPLSHVLKLSLKGGVVSPQLQFIDFYRHSLSQLVSDDDTITVLVDQIVALHDQNLQEIKKFMNGWDGETSAIFYSNQRFFELIFDRVANETTQRGEKIKKWLKVKEWEVVGGSNTWIHCQPKGDDFIEKVSDVFGGGKSGGALLADFVISNRKDKITLQFQIRDLGGDDRKQTRRRDFLRAVHELGGGEGSRGEKSFPKAFYSDGSPRKSSDAVESPNSRGDRYFSIYSDAETIVSAGEVEEKLEKLWDRLEGRGTVVAIEEIVARLNGGG